MTGNLLDTLPALATPGYPNFLAIEPTSVCNLRCEMCGLPSGRSASTQHPGPLVPEVFARALKAAERVGAVCFNGIGEAFADRLFLSRLEELDRRGITIVFSTNGTLVTPEHAARLAKLERLLTVNVSLDSADPELYLAVRGRDQSLALRGLEALAAEPLLLPKITVSAVVWERTLPGLAGFPELLSKYRITGLVLQGLVPPPEEETPGSESTSAAIRAAVDAVSEECAARGIALLVVPYLSWQTKGDMPEIWKERPPQLTRDAAEAGRNLPATRQCGAPWEHAGVDKDGRMFPCCLAPDWGERGVVGNLRTHTFEEAWTGEPFRKFRLGLLTGDLPEICRSCPATSTGPHFYSLYAARLLPDSRPARSDRVRVAVQNAGAATWTRETKLRIGTSRRRDRHSRLHQPSWISRARVGTFVEETVLPGTQATFFMDVPAGESLEGETFQLVVDGLCWLPGTEFGLERREGLLRARPLATGLEPSR